MTQVMTLPQPGATTLPALQQQQSGHLAGMQLAAGDLALRYQRCETGALQLLWHRIRPAMFEPLAVYRRNPWFLPAGLEFDDLEQQSWLILAQLAMRWDPYVASFLTYFRASFPGMLASYVRRMSPNRRSATVRVLNESSPGVGIALAQVPDEDGRTWDSDLIAQDILSGLSDVQRAVMQLHVLDGVPLRQIARRRGCGANMPDRAYRRAKRIAANTSDPH